MNKKDEALKLALDAVENCTEFRIGNPYYERTSAAIREVLAQPEQEPVGEVLNEKGEVDWISFVPPIGANLYTTPQPAVPEREPLTDEEIKRRKPISADFVSFRAGVRCMEREYRIGEKR